MADPFKTEENTLPEPHAEFAGVNRKDSFGKKAFAAMARLWRPRGSSMEPTSATVARYAMRLIDRKTGRAYSVDEMVASIPRLLEIESTGATDLMAVLGVKPARPYVHGSNSGMKVFRQRLELGHSAAGRIISDSTGTGTVGWPYRFGQELCLRYPNHRVELRLSDPNGTNNEAFHLLHPGSERLHWYVPAGTVNAARIPNASLRTSPTGRYLSIEVECTIDGLASLNGSNYPTAGAALGFIDGGGANLAAFSMNNGGRLELNYHDGSGFQTILSPTGGTNLIPPLLPGAYFRYRVRLDTADGVNKSAIFDYSTDQGQTWIQLGSAVSSAKSASSNINLGSAPGIAIGRTNGPSFYPGFKYSHMQVGIGANYEPIVPERVDAFCMTPGATTNTMLLQGSPTIYLDVIAVNGAGVLPSGWFTTTLPSHAWKLLRDRNHDWCAISTGHNEVGIRGGSLAVGLDALRSLVQSRSVQAPHFIHISQNPESTDYAAVEIREQSNRRGADVLAFAASKGSTGINVQQAFYDDGRTLAGILIKPLNGSGQPDGVHPTDTEGQLLWLRTWMQAFVDGTNEINP